MPSKNGKSVKIKNLNRTENNKTYLIDRSQLIKQNVLKKKR